MSALLTQCEPVISDRSPRGAWDRRVLAFGEDLDKLVRFAGGLAHAAARQVRSGLQVSPDSAEALAFHRRLMVSSSFEGGLPVGVEGCQQTKKLAFDYRLRDRSMIRPESLAEGAIEQTWRRMARRWLWFPEPPGAIGGRLELILVPLDEALDEQAFAPKGEGPLWSQGADGLMLCVDVQDNPSHFYGLLPTLLRRLRSTRSLRCGPPALVPGEILVALTGVRELAERVWECNPSGPSSEALLQNVNPVEQARALMGDAALRMILDGAGPRARTAIGVVSTSSPLRSLNCTPGSARVRHEMTRWDPYGIVEAMSFLLGGQVRGPVQVLDARSLDEPGLV